MILLSAKNISTPSRHNLEDYTSSFVAITHLENMYQYQTETRRLAKVWKNLFDLIKQFSYKSQKLYKKYSSTKALLSVSIEPSESRKSIENVLSTKITK